MDIAFSLIAVGRASFLGMSYVWRILRVYLLHAMKIYFYLILSLSLLLNGCSKTTGSSSYGSDNKWWKCNLDAKKGCESGKLEDMGLSSSEIKYVNEVLDNAPWFPAKVNSKDIIKYFGAPPHIDVGGEVIFEKDAHGLCDGCGVTVYIIGNYMKMIRYYVPNKFLLVRHNPKNK